MFWVIYKHTRAHTHTIFKISLWIQYLNKERQCVRPETNGIFLKMSMCIQIVTKYWASVAWQAYFRVLWLLDKPTSECYDSLTSLLQRAMTPWQAYFRRAFFHVIAFVCNCRLKLFWVTVLWITLPKYYTVCYYNQYLTSFSYTSYFSVWMYRESCLPYWRSVWTQTWFPLSYPTSYRSLNRPQKKNTQLI